MLKHTFWIIANKYGRIFSRAWLIHIHHAILIFVLHGLGYDNTFRPSFTGETWFIKNVLRKHKPSVCIDVGANIGNYSKKLIDYTDAKVYSIEPSSSSFEELSKKCKDNCFNFAVADFNGEATLYSKEEKSETASLDPAVSDGGGEKVKVITLEKFVHDQGIEVVDFLKIDTEGYEKEVIKGMGSLQPKLIQFEFNLLHLRRHCTLYDICELLPNYSFYRLLPNGWVKIDKNSFVNNIFMFSNFIAVRL